MKKEQILCPGREHSRYKKTLFFKDKDRLYVYCKIHGWVGVQFLKDGIPVSFEHTAVALTPANSETGKFESKDTVTVSFGRFNKR